MFSPARLLAPVATALLLLGSGCGPVPTAAESKAEPVATRAEKKTPVVVDPTPASAETPERQQFLDLVRKHVQDPAGLEVVEWGDITPNGKGRPVKFRCKLVANRRAGPVMLESAMINYEDDGKTIKAVYPVNVPGIWRAK